VSSQAYFIEPSKLLNPREKAKGQKTARKIEFGALPSGKVFTQSVHSH